MTLASAGPVRVSPSNCSALVPMQSHRPAVQRLAHHSLTVHPHHRHQELDLTPPHMHSLHPELSRSESTLRLSTGPGQLLHAGGWGGPAGSALLPGSCCLDAFSGRCKHHSLLPALQLAPPLHALPHLWGHTEA